MRASLIGPATWCMLAAALFGVSPAACKLLLGEQMGPLALASLLYLGAGFATLPFAVLHRTKEKPSRSENVRVGLAVVFGGILGPIFLMFGIHQSDAGSASLLLNFESVATVILGWMLFKEHVSRSVFLSSILVVAAGVWLSFPEQMTLNPGALWIILACFCWGIDNHVTAVIDGYTPTQTTCIKGLVAGTVNALIAFGFADSWGSVSLIGGGLAVGALCYGASMVLYVASAQQLGATRSQMIFASAPYWGLICAWVVVAEPILWAQIGSTILMIFALVILQLDRHSHTHTHRAMRHIHWHYHRDGHHEHTHTEGSPKTVLGWHIHGHEHIEHEHSHPHRDDLHHRHH